MKINGQFLNTSFQASENFPECLNDFVDDNELFNHPELLFFEEKYMEECNRFSNIVNKFKIKQFNSNLKIFSNNELQKVEDFSDEVILYDQIILSNNVNINGFQKKDLSISVKHFEQYKKSPKIDFIQSIYILLFLSNVVEYDDNKFIFKVECDDKEVEKQIVFDEIENFNLFEIYSWVIASKENIQTRLKIIRELITRKNSFKLSDKDLCCAKSIFNRIIKEETESYFSQVNVLKDDFLKLSERKQESYQALHLKFIGWSSAIALFIYSEIKDRPSGDLFQKILFSKTEKSLLFLIIFIISLVVIWIIFLKEIDENIEEYEKIKEFYTTQLFFNEDNFSEIIDEPKVPFLYISIFSILLGMLFLRLIVFLQ